MLLIKTFIWFILIVGVVIFVHEFGHYIAARIARIKVEEFAFGFGRKVFGKKIGETLYRVNLIPMGGYVRVLGQEEESKDPRSFSKKAFGFKMGVIVAGVIMNFFLAVITFYGVLAIRGYEIHVPRISEYNFWGSQTQIQNKPIIREVIPDTPAAAADFPKDVIIWKVEDIEVTDVADVTNALSAHKGQEIEIELLTFEGNWITRKVTPSDTGREGVLLGVEFYDVVASFYKLDYSHTKFLSGFLHSINFTGYTLDIFKELISISVEEKSVKPVSEGVSGVVGVANRVFELVRVGDMVELLNLVAGINLSLAIINLLPIPGMDGGHAMFLILEKIRGKKIAERYQEWATRIGFVILIVLGILITIKDVIQFDIIERLKNVIGNIF